MKPETIIFLCLLSFYLCGMVNTQVCNPYKTCGDCLRHPNCVWCKDEKFTLNKLSFTRCATLQEHHNNCTDLVKLEKPTLEKEPNRGTNGTIEPKSYFIKLGVEQTVNFEMEYKDPGNKPLDLYYLMDLSYTMHDDKEAVIILGQQLAGALKSTTKDLQMGFGSFIDKPMMPYATLGQINQKETHNMTKPYGFRNHLNLTKNHPEFETAVKDAKISANLDAPEGGLDAIMQAIVCKSQIGWRDEARRMLVLSTDGTFHIAGDGKLGGIITPNDGRCHMENNIYTHSTLLDYPSISQIISKVHEEKIFVIFAVVEQERSLYEELASLLHPYASTIILNSKSTRVDELVRDQYERIRTRVELLMNKPSQISDITRPVPYIEINYKSKCNPNSPFVPGYKCEGVGSGAKLKFNIEVKLLYCPEDKSKWKTSFDISTTTTTSTNGTADKLRIDLELACGCDCENENTGGGENCNNQGSLRCGICSCKQDYLGEYCNCQKNSVSGGYDDESKCRRPSTTSPCSGKGSCTCGQCSCDKDYRGEFCECNQRNCPTKNGLQCSGNGVCDCEKCRCNTGYKGTACDCPDSESSCKRPGYDGLCSGEGHCKCNKCECNAGRGGLFCQVCLHQNICPCMKEVEDFVKCSITEHNSTHIKKQNEDTKMSCLNNTKNFIVVDTIDVYDKIDPIISRMEKSCTIENYVTRRSSDCHLSYKYSFRDRSESIIISVRKQLSCPQQATSPLIIILATIGSILIIGILTLLLWKIITFCHDKREYTKFEQERKGAKWDASGNPLYKEATSTFKNPAYTE